MQGLVTVFGGSGFVGRHTVRALARSGWRIRVAVRHPNRAFFLRPLGSVGQIDIIKCDITDPDQVARVHRAFDRIFTAALARGGTITGEHGVGITKLAYLEQRVGPVGIDVLRGIKRAFDPLGLLNPGKAVP